MLAMLLPSYNGQASGRTASTARTSYSAISVCPRLGSSSGAVPGSATGVLVHSAHRLHPQLEVSGLSLPSTRTVTRMEMTASCSVNRTAYAPAASVTSAIVPAPSSSQAAASTDMMQLAPFVLAAAAVGAMFGSWLSGRSTTPHDSGSPGLLSRLGLAAPVAVLQYKLMQVFNLPLYGKLIAILLVAAPIILLGSWALTHVTGLSWGEALQQAYFVLNNVPGMDICSIDTQGAQLVLLLIHLASLFTFAGVVGLVTQDISNAVAEVRSGNFAIPEAGHTVVLGGGAKLAHVLRSILDARERHGGTSFPGCLAVLSPQPKESLDAALLRELGEARMAQLVTRTGSPLKVCDLELVAAGSARRVIVLQESCMLMAGEEGGEEEEGGSRLSGAVAQDVAMAALSAAVHAHHGRLSRALLPLGAWRGVQGVVVESSGGGGGVLGGGEAGTGACAFQCSRSTSQVVTRVSSSASESRIAVQAALQPGLVRVFGALLRQRGAELHAVAPPTPPPGAQPWTYGSMRHLFPRACVCGVVTAGGASVLSPPDSRHVVAGEQLVVLARLRGDAVPCSSRVAGMMREGQPAHARAPHNSSSSSSASARASGADTVAPTTVSMPPPARGSEPSTQGNTATSHPSDVLLSGAAATAPAPTSSPALLSVDSTPLSLALLNFSGSLGCDVQSALAEFIRRPARITVVGSDVSCVPEAPMGPARCLVYEEAACEPLDMQGLAAAGVAQADAVILTGLEALCPDARDAHVVAALLRVSGLLQAQARMAAHMAAAEGQQQAAALAGLALTQPLPLATSATHGPLVVVCSISDPRTRGVIDSVLGQHSRTAAAVTGSSTAGDVASATFPIQSRGLCVEAIEPDALLSGVLIQVASTPSLAGVLGDLLDEDGCELYLRPPRRGTKQTGGEQLGASLPVQTHTEAPVYVFYDNIPTDTPVLWSQVVDAVRAHGDTPLGVLRAPQPQGQSDAGSSAEPDLLLAPACDSEVVLSLADRLVVLSEH